MVDEPSEPTETDEREDAFLRAVAEVRPLVPSPTDSLGPGTVLADKYELLEVIGRGGMAVVFAARHRVTQRRVAVKWMRPRHDRDDRAERRFLREVRAASSIEHPNVVAVYDAGTHAGAPYLVMELLQGHTLRARIKQGPVSLDEALAITHAVIAGVSEAHSHGILHRDIKPDNVFLCDRSDAAAVPKVLDFGVAGALREVDGELSTLTDHGTIVGTPGYMPLEQLQGAVDLDRRVDVYAVGVMLYEMLTGQRPFPARTYADLILQLATSVPTRPQRLCKGMRPGLSAVIMRALARDRRDRWADLGSFAQALREEHCGHRPRRRAAVTLTATSALALALSVSYANGESLVAQLPWGTPVTPSARPMQQSRPRQAASVPAQRQRTRSPVAPPSAATRSDQSPHPVERAEREQSEPTPTATATRAPATAAALTPRTAPTKVKRRPRLAVRDEAPKPPRTAAAAPTAERALHVRRSDF